MTIPERIKLYEDLYKNCKAVLPVAEILDGFDDKSQLDKLEILRDCTTKLVSKEGYYGCICPTVTPWVRVSNYVSSTNEIYLTQPQIKDFLRMFRLHLQNMARDPGKEDLLTEGNEGITKAVLYKKAESKLYGWDDARAWAEMVIQRATL